MVYGVYGASRSSEAAYHSFLDDIYSCWLGVVTVGTGTLKR